MSETLPKVDLATLRQEIDRIDEAMHRLLMERGEIIDQLIAVKKTQESGSAFRPGREADMMRRLAARHKGILPLDTAESILRVIIATFTYVQAPYRVHADISGGDAPMRDSARFHFGFTVPYVPHASAAEVIAAVAASKGDLGIFRPDQGTASGAWWERLAAPEAPKVIARLPFIERPDHPALHLDASDLAAHAGGLCGGDRVVGGPGQFLAGRDLLLELVEARLLAVHGLDRAIERRCGGCADHRNLPLSVQLVASSSASNICCEAVMTRAAAW